jgi:PrcB C-terminal
MPPTLRRALVLAALLVVALLCTWQFSPRTTTPIDSYASCATAGYPVTDTSPATCSDGTHAFVGPTQAPAPSEAPVTSLSYQILVDGDPGGTYPRTQQVITTQTDWVKYWSAVHAALPTLPPLLPVDFSQNQVIALNEGPEPTNGYSLSVTSVSDSSSGTTVQVTRTTPVPACHPAQVPSNRYLLVLTPKLTAPVSFDITNIPRNC